MTIRPPPRAGAEAKAQPLPGAAARALTFAAHALSRSRREVFERPVDQVLLAQNHTAPVQGLSVALHLGPFQTVVVPAPKSSPAPAGQGARPLPMVLHHSILQTADVPPPPPAPPLRQAALQQLAARVAMGGARTQAPAPRAAVVATPPVERVLVSGAGGQGRADPGTPPGPALPDRPARPAAIGVQPVGTAPAFAPPQIERLAEDVMRLIDTRFVRYRERFGGR